MAGTEVVRKRGRLSAGNCESSGSQAGSYAETQAGKGRRMQIPDLVLHGSSVFYILYNDYIIRTVGGVVVLKRDVSAAGCRNHFRKQG